MSVLALKLMSHGCYRAPLTIPGTGIVNEQKNFYLSDFRQSKLSLLAGVQLINSGRNLRFGQEGMTFIPSLPKPRPGYPYQDRKLRLTMA